MSIFKSTLKKYIQDQVNARQKLLNSQGTRPLDLQKYVSGKAPWVKMTSFVDYADVNKNPDAQPNKDLAKQYVLMGGTLYPQPGDKTDEFFGLRSGILNKSAAYGTNLGTGTTDKVNLQYGIRPMPGISSVNIKSKSAYGSLREATVKFYAWDVHQLEDLLILYMRPGYPVLLEWGWSMYLDNKDGKIRSFDTPTINCFQDGLTQDAVYESLEKYRKQLSGNYDGLLGLIRNYETSMLPNGGFECTVTLISIGDVLDSLRMNTENGDMSYLTDPGTDQPSGSPTDKEDLKDEFELLLTGYTRPRSLDYIPMTVFNRIADIDKEADAISGVDKNIYYSSGPKPKSPDGNTPSDDGDYRTRYYMQFAYFIHLLNSQKNLYANGKKVLDIEIPVVGIDGNLGNGLCVASINSMTVDNNSCIIKNTSAKIVSETDGFLPQVVFADFIAHPLTEGVGTTITEATSVMNEYLYSDTKLGVIGNIYVNIGKLIDLYKIEHKHNNGFVYLGKYIKSVLSSLEYSLGSINNFDIFVNDNKVVIIDKHYVEEPADSKYSSKYQLNILGTDSIVRHQKIVSKIFPSQATIIAIAAQSRENIASLQSSTYNYMNRGLKSRLIPNIEATSTQASTEADREKEIYNKNLQSLIYYITNNIIPFNPEYNKVSNINAVNTMLNNFLVVINKATNYKAIIPVSLELTLDGIGGLTIGEIFTINKDILPREYADKSVGFIITGISQDITRPDWATTVHTQFCLLDQAELDKGISTSIDQLLSGFKAYVEKSKDELRRSIRMYNIMAGLFTDLLNSNFDVSYYANDNPRNAYDFIKVKYKQGSTTFNNANVKYLQARLEENNLTINGERLTLETFLDDVARQFAFTLRNEKGLSALNEYNDKGYLVFTQRDNEVLTGTKYYQYIKGEVKNEFAGMVNKVLGLRRNGAKKIIFNLLDEKSSISEQGTYTPKFLEKDITILDVEPNYNAEF